MCTAHCDAAYLGQGESMIYFCLVQPSSLPQTDISPALLKPSFPNTDTDERMCLRCLYNRRSQITPVTALVHITAVGTVRDLGAAIQILGVQTRDYIVTLTGHTNDSTLPAQPYQLLKQNLLNLSSRNKSTVSYLLYKQHVIQNKKQIYKSFIECYNFSLEISSLFSSRNEISLTIEKL